MIKDVDSGHNPLADDPATAVTIDRQERAKIQSTMGQVSLIRLFNNCNSLITHYSQPLCIHDVVRLQ